MEETTIIYKQESYEIMGACFEVSIYRICFSCDSCISWFPR